MIYLFLPAYNEEKSIKKLFTRIIEVKKNNNLDLKIILLNDGSKDKTLSEVNKFKKKIDIEVLNHEINRGLGETIRDGFEHIAKISKRDDILIRMDCDISHDPKYIPRLVEKINQGNDIVICSRFQKGGSSGDLSLYRLFISRCANLLMKIMLPVKGVREYSCAYRAYRCSLVKDAINIYGNYFIDLKGLGFTCSIEKLVKFGKMGAKITEIPFVLRYDLKESQSKMVSSITTLGYLVLILKNIYPWGKIGQRLDKVLKRYRSKKNVRNKWNN